MFDELLARIADALDARALPYMVIGGQAVLLYGEPRLTRAIDGKPVHYAGPEDLVVHKMLAGRPRDLEDVRSIVVRQKALDRQFIRTQLADFDSALDRDLVAQFDAILTS